MKLFRCILAESIRGAGNLVAGALATIALDAVGLGERAITATETLARRVEP